MFNPEAIIKSIMSACDKDSKAYKVTEYYRKLTSDALDEGCKALFISKITSIEKELKKWMKKHPPNKESTVMSQEESALRLIDDLRERETLRAKHD